MTIFPLRAGLAGLAGLMLACGRLFGAPAEDPLTHLRPGHPRLLLTDADLAAAVSAAQTDPRRAALHARIVSAAAESLDDPALRPPPAGGDMLDEARSAVRHIVTCALAFRLTHDARFAARARGDMLTAAGFPHWNPDHFLDVAEMSFALAIGYDWLQPELSPADRAAIRQALREKSLSFAAAAYAPGGPTDPRLWWATARTNWNQVCNSGLLSAAPGARRRRAGAGPDPPWPACARACRSPWPATNPTAAIRKARGIGLTEPPTP